LLTAYFSFGAAPANHLDSHWFCRALAACDGGLEETTSQRNPTSMTLPAINPFSPLGLVVGDIERAYHAKLYYPALLVALTVPEVCEGLILDKSEIVKQKHYVGFVEKYAPQSELGVSGIECYRMRGGLVHRADFAGHPKAEWTNIIFTIPETGTEVHGITVQGITAQGEVAKTGILLSLRNFCVTMVNAANTTESFG
jgi:hypothetical protein